MSEPLLLIDTDRPAVTILTLNRPEKRNALSVELMQSLCTAMTEAEADASQRVLILRGAGPAFCAGLDLREAAETDDRETSAQLVAQTLKTLYQSRLVTIAAVHGTAAAGGAGLMSACDLAVAATNAHIGYPEVHRGLVAALVMGFLSRQVGQRHTAELLMLGQFIDAPRAREIGLVNRVVPSNRVLDESLILAEVAQQGGPNAVEQTKKFMREISPRRIVDDLDCALEYHLRARNSAEAEEGLAAFIEKRTPHWAKVPQEKAEENTR